MHLIDTCAQTNRWRDRHPAEKLLLAGGMLALSLTLPPYPACLFILLAMMTITLVGARVPARAYVRVFALPLGFLLVGALSLTLSVGLDSAGRPRVVFSQEGALTAARVTMRSLAALACLLFLALTTPMAELLMVLRRIGIPLAIIDLMSLTYRFVFVFVETAQTMSQAQASRLGYGSLRRAYRSLAMLTVSFLGRALDRVRRLQTGLASRGYQGDLRVLWTPQRARPKVLVGIVAMQLLVAGLSLGASSVLQGAPAEAGPQRIVSLGPPLTEQLYLLGLGDRVVGVTTYCERPAEAKKKPRVGTVLQPDVEKIVTLKPDLVLVTSLTDVRAVAKLQQLGLRVETFGSSRNFEDLCTQFQRLARQVGREKEAAAIVAECRRRVAAIREKASHSYKPRVFVQLGANPLFTANKEYFIHDLVVLAGGVNIAADIRGGLYSIEKVIEADPEVILITLMGVNGEMEKAHWQRFKTLSAVKHNRIYLLDPYKSCSPNPVTFAEVLEEIAQYLRLGNE